MQDESAQVFPIFNTLFFITCPSSFKCKSFPHRGSVSFIEFYRIFYTDFEQVDTKEICTLVRAYTQIF